MNFLKHRGTDKVTIIASEIGPGIAGKLREYWDDHVDAKAFVKRSYLHVPEHGLLTTRQLIVPDHVAGFRNGLVVPAVAGGAFSVGGLYLLNQIDVYDATQLAIDLSLTSHKVAMYTDTLSPNFSTNVSYAATNEVSGTGYTAGGKTLATGAAGGGSVSPTLTESPTGTMKYDHDDFVWAAPTSVTARGAITYADALAADNLIVAQAFGADITSTAGTFTIVEPAAGVFTVDWTP